MCNQGKEKEDGGRKNNKGLLSVVELGEKTKEHLKLIDGWFVAAISTV